MSHAPHEHFQGKEAIQHVVEAKTQGLLDQAEPHGTETPGYIAGGADAARGVAIALLLLWAVIAHLPLSIHQQWIALSILGISLSVWKIGRSAWLGWFRLERLHRVAAEEKWEIEHNREQEREELSALYAAKGFEGKLLEDVMDVLMADGDRLLCVMLEEELGLTLEGMEHPVKQSLGAGAGAFLATICCSISFFAYPPLGLVIGALSSVGVAAAVQAHYNQNSIIPAVIWNTGIAVLTYGFSYFLLKFFYPNGL